MTASFDRGVARTIARLAVDGMRTAAFTLRAHGWPDLADVLARRADIDQADIDLHFARITNGCERETAELEPGKGA